MRGWFYSLLSVWLLTFSAAVSAQNKLTWTSATPMQGPAGTSVTAIVAISPPLPSASMEGYDMIFNSPDGKGVIAEIDQAAADADPISQLRLTGKVPQGAVTGTLAVVVYLRGVAQPLVVGSPTPFQVTGGGTTPPPPAGGNGARWVDATPMQGAVGTQVTITVALNPPVPYAALDEVRLGFSGPGNTVIEAEILDGQDSGDPITQFQILGVVPDQAVTGPITVLVGVVGQQNYWVAESPTPFQVGGGGVTPPTGNFKLTWTSATPMQGPAGTSVTAIVAISPPLPSASMEGYDMIFNSPDGKGVIAEIDQAAADADPISQLRLTGKVPQGAVTGTLAVVVYLRGVAQPLVVGSPSPFIVGSGTPPTPSVTQGDLTGDGKVNVQDATLSLRIAVGSITATDAQKAAGDVNGDGKVNVQDTTLILRRAVGSLTAFPAG